MSRVLVVGGGGFIGGHLVRSLLDEGNDVRVLDQKPVDGWNQQHRDAENLVGDAGESHVARRAVDGCEMVYHLACDMGGMGFIEGNKALCTLSVLADAQILRQAVDSGVERLFYASTACVYPQERQSTTDPEPLREEFAYPADPEDGYGWQKLFGERMCRHFQEDFGLAVRVARYHNIYGPECTWDGGREKAPAALCRKVATAKLTGSREVEVWGDGEQARSFLFVDDCVAGTRRLMDSDVDQPLNIGSEEMVTINELLSLVEDVAAVSLERSYVPSAPQGVRGRSSDNTLVRASLGWEPSIALRDGIARTYGWIEAQVAQTLSA